MKLKIKVNNILTQPNKINQKLFFLQQNHKLWHTNGTEKFLYSIMNIKHRKIAYLGRFMGGEKYTYLSINHDGRLNKRAPWCIIISIEGGAIFVSDC